MSQTTDNTSRTSVSSTMSEIENTQKRAKSIFPGGIRIALLGPPGSGKGTQASHLGRRLNIAHLATGDMLRAAVRRGNSTGVRAKMYMEKGQLVPDEIIISLIEEAIKAPEFREGFVLDGYPRTVEQARRLDEILKVQNKQLCATIVLQVADDLLAKRILGRLVHPPSGRTYHEEFDPPKIAFTDDVTGDPLVRRSDDTLATLDKRLNAYHSQTEPVIQYYKETGILRKIDASLPPDRVWDQLLATICP